MHKKCVVNKIERIKKKVQRHAISMPTVLSIERYILTSACICGANSGRQSTWDTHHLVTIHTRPLHIHTSTALTVNCCYLILRKTTFTLGAFPPILSDDCDKALVAVGVTAWRHRNHPAGTATHGFNAYATFHRPSFGIPSRGTGDPINCRSWWFRGGDFGGGRKWGGCGAVALTAVIAGWWRNQVVCCAGTPLASWWCWRRHRLKIRFLCSKSVFVMTLYVVSPNEQKNNSSYHKHSYKREDKHDVIETRVGAWIWAQEQSWASHCSVLIDAGKNCFHCWSGSRRYPE